MVPVRSVEWDHKNVIAWVHLPSFTVLQTGPARADREVSTLIAQLRMLEFPITIYRRRLAGKKSRME